MGNPKPKNEDLEQQENRRSGHLCISNPPIAGVVSCVPSNINIGDEDPVNLKLSLVQQVIGSPTCTMNEYLTQHQKFLESVLDSIPNPLFLLEVSTGKVKFANRMANEMVGGRFLMDASTTEYYGAYEMTNLEGRVLAYSEWPGARAISGEVLRDLEVVWRTPQGCFSLLVDSEPVPAVNGEPAQVIVIFRDVTKMKAFELELKHLIGIRDEFLSIASHELKTPITSLKMQIQMTERRVRPESGMEPCLEKISKALHTSSIQVNRLISLVEDLLDVTRLQIGQLNFHFAPCDLLSLLREVIERFQGQLATSGSSISLICTDDLVAGIWDSIRIEQVINNLISNAIKYAPRTEILVELRAGQNGISLSVQDFGRGIPKSFQTSIFEKFQRGSASRNMGGLGLGLFISKQIVDGHRGAIDLESELGQGAKFTVHLPYDSLGKAVNDPSQDLSDLTKDDLTELRSKVSPEAFNELCSNESF